jgi:hypothetical protein
LEHHIVRDVGAEEEIMPQILRVLSAMAIAVAVAQSLAHALELPGKRRLTKEQYFAVQRIYYPGLTYGGAAEPIGILLILLLLCETAVGTTQFWLEAAAFLALLLMHATYWLVTHPLNNFWYRDIDAKKIAAGFFSFDPLRGIDRLHGSEWTLLRDRWELSHAVRAGLAYLSLTLLVVAIAVSC